MWVFLRWGKMCRVCGYAFFKLLKFEKYIYEKFEFN